MICEDCRKEMLDMVKNIDSGCANEDPFWFSSMECCKDEMIKLLEGEFQKPDILCRHCHMPLKIRNPSGYCDHLYYPDNCKVCKEQTK